MEGTWRARGGHVEGTRGARGGQALAIPRGNEPSRLAASNGHDSARASGVHARTQKCWRVHAALAWRGVPAAGM